MTWSLNSSYKILGRIYIGTGAREMEEKHSLLFHRTRVQLLATHRAATVISVTPVPGGDRVPFWVPQTAYVMGVHTYRQNTDTHEK